MTAIRLLIAYDGSDAAAGAVRAAGRLFPGARAAVVYARSEPLALDESPLVRTTLPPSVVATAVESYEQEAALATSAIAERGAAIAVAAGLDATPHVRPGTSASRALCAAAAELEADVIVCGTRGRGGLARALLGTTSSALLHHAPLPLLVVPAGAEELAGPLLVGYDGSPGARAAVRACGRLLAGRDTLVAHAWSSPLQHSFAGSALVGVPLPEIQELATDLEGAIASSASATADEGVTLARECGLDPRPLAIEGPASTWRALAAAAEREGAAIVAVGSRGRGAAAATALGSVSAALVHNAALPTLVVPSEEDDRAY